jgi:hypothetical protein
MDIDTVIEQLRAVMEVKKGGLVDAVSAAPKLLRLPRYKLAEDRQKLLASDIEAAIARLPPDVASDANNLLPITQPTSYLNARWQAIGAGGYSAPAKTWRWKSVFGRLAIELLKLQDNDSGQQSYRVLFLHIDVNVTYKGAEQHRMTSFEWRIQSIVPDMRWFGFTHNVHDLKLKDWDCQSEGHAKVGRVPVRSMGEDGDYWYVVSLGEALPVGKPVTIKAVTHAVGPRNNYPWLSYTMPFQVDRLLLTAEAPRAEATKFTCQELTGGEVIAKTEYQRDADASMSYEPSTPHKGHTYRLDWRV